MLHRILSLAAALAVVVFVGSAGAADKAAPDTSHSGIVVSAADGKLTMTDKQGKNEHSHVVAKDAKIKLDDKPCKLEDLKKGDKVTVTLGKENGETVAVDVQAESATAKDKEEKKDK